MTTTQLESAVGQFMKCGANFRLYEINVRQRTRLVVSGVDLKFSMPVH